MTLTLLERLYQSSWNLIYICHATWGHVNGVHDKFLSSVIPTLWPLKLFRYYPKYYSNAWTDPHDTWLCISYHLRSSQQQKSLSAVVPALYVCVMSPEVTSTAEIPVRSSTSFVCMCHITWGHLNSRNPCPQQYQLCMYVSCQRRSCQRHTS
jgi:hypothetical protein